MGCASGVSRMRRSGGVRMAIEVRGKWIEVCDLVGKSDRRSTIAAWL